jgi:hypothetical protein
MFGRRIATAPHVKGTESMDHMLLALQNSAFAYWLSQGVYPPIITLHSMGMALLVGLQVVINLRVLGFGVGIAFGALRRLMKVVWIGFWVNAFSGILLFSITPDKFVHSALFLLKMSLIATGLILGALMNSSLLSVGDEYGPGSLTAPPRAKTLAVLSLTCWMAAIVTGRWLAYTTFGDVGIGTDG